MINMMLNNEEEIMMIFIYYNNMMMYIKIDLIFIFPIIMTNLLYNFNC